MGIEDIQISEELETNAPSIKYSGNEGPKSPQEMEQMMMAQLEEEYAKYVFEMQEQGIEPMSMQQFIEQAMAEGQMSGGTPLPNDPTKPVNPFQPKPTGPVLPDRQMAAYGGIMGLDGRRKYGFGSSLKKKIRNIIPNELADIAVKAAPFVAMIPGQQGTAALMRGIGRFDQRGSISDALKQGALTYGFGKYIGGPLTSKIPGIGTDYSGLGGFKQFGTDLGGSLQGGYNALKTKLAPANISEGIPRISGGDYGQFAEPTNLYDEVALTKGNIASKVGVEAAEEAAKKTLPKKIMDSLSKAGLGNNLVTGLLAGGLGASALMGNMEPEEIQDLQRGEGLDIESIRTEVIEAMKDPSGEALEAIRIKYPFLGTQRSKNMANGGRIGFDNGGGIMMASSDMGDPKENAEYYSQRMFGKPYKELNADELEEFQEEMRRLMNKFMSNGGRINRAEGGIMDLGGMEKDYRAEGGFVPIGREEKADDVPARLSVNEFVFTADAVRNAGGGDIDKGAEVMENMMKYLEQGGQVSEESQGMAGAQQMFETSERLSEVI